MRAVIQRVIRATVSADGNVIGECGSGLLVLLGVGKDDTDADVRYIADKVINMRIFSDENGKMNLSLTDVCGEMLIISQFTLYGDCSHGRRPFFGDAMEPETAEKMYENFVEYIKSKGIYAETGKFGADMKVELVNDGPVTIILESK